LILFTGIYQRKMLIYANSDKFTEGPCLASPDRRTYQRIPAGI
jgi:hypothetical protein